MKRIILTYTLAFSLLSAYAGEGGSPPLKNTDKSLLIDYVDPFIGTTNFGTTNPGAICPNGMMSVVPFNSFWRSLDIRFCLVSCITINY